MLVARSPELRQGLFADSGTREVAVRLAQGPGEHLPDRVHTHRDMGIGASLDAVGLQKLKNGIPSKTFRGSTVARLLPGDPRQTAHSMSFRDAYT